MTNPEHARRRSFGHSSFSLGPSRPKAAQHAVFLLIVTVWGTSFILMKHATTAFGPVTIGAARLLSAAAVLAVVFAVTRRRKPLSRNAEEVAGAAGRRGGSPTETTDPPAPPTPPGDLLPPSSLDIPHSSFRTPPTPWPFTRRDAPALLLVAVAGYAYPFCLQPYLIGRTGASAFFGALVCLVPLFTLLVSVPLLKTHPTRAQLLGVLGGLACLALVLADARRAAAAVSLPIALLGCTVPLAYASCNTYVKRRFHDTPALPLVLTVCVLGGTLLLPIATARETLPTTWTTPTYTAAAATLFLGMVGTGLATFLFYRLILRAGPLYAGMVTYLIPLVALAWGAADHEGVTALQVAGILGVLAMVAITQSAKPRRV